MLGIETAFRDELNRFIFVKWVKMGKMGRMGKIGNTPDWSSNKPLDKIWKRLRFWSKFVEDEVWS